MPFYTQALIVWCYRLNCSLGGPAISLITMITPMFILWCSLGRQITHFADTWWLLITSLTTLRVVKGMRYTSMFDRERLYFSCLKMILPTRAAIPDPLVSRGWYMPLNLTNEWRVQPSSYCVVDILVLYSIIFIFPCQYKLTSKKFESNSVPEIIIMPKMWISEC